MKKSIPEGLSQIRFTKATDALAAAASRSVVWARVSCEIASAQALRLLVPYANGMAPGRPRPVSGRHSLASDSLMPSALCKVRVV